MPTVNTNNVQQRHPEFVLGTVEQDDVGVCVDVLGGSSVGNKELGKVSLFVLLIKIPLL